MELPSKMSRDVHSMDDNVTLEWLYDGKAFFLSLKTVDRTAIDTWYEVIKAIAIDWTVEEPFLAIYDLTGIGLTPYFRQRGIDVADAVRHLHGRYALIISDEGSTAQVMRLFFQLDVRRASDRVGRIHPDRQSAQQWIEELL